MNDAPRMRVLNRVQPAMMARVLTFPLDYFTTHSPGDLLAVISGIAASAADGVTRMVEPIFIVVQALYLVLLLCPAVMGIYTDRGRLMEEFHRILKPGSTLCATAEHLDVNEFLDAITQGNLFMLVDQKGNVFRFRR